MSDDFFKYLVVTDQLDDFLGIDKEESDEIDDEFDIDDIDDDIENIEN